MLIKEGKHGFLLKLYNDTLDGRWKKYGDTFVSIDHLLFIMNQTICFIIIELLSNKFIFKKKKFLIILLNYKIFFHGVMLNGVVMGVCKFKHR